MRKELSGCVCSEGCCYATIAFMEETQLKEKHIDKSQADDECRRFKEAHVKALSLTYGLADNSDSEAKALFEAQAEMLEDASFTNQINKLIKEDLLSAESAVTTAKEHYYAIFDAMNDEYMKARALDVSDISKRLLSVLVKSQKKVLTSDSIVVSEEITAGDILSLDLSLLKGIVTKKGSVLSHAAIIARSLAIPMLANIEVPACDNGKEAVITANGTLVVEPKPREIVEATHYNTSLEEENVEGCPVDIYINANSIKDIETLAQNKAKGIGLLRSEMLFLNADKYPGEEEQFLVYKEALETAKGLPVTIRVFDFGEDKRPSYLQMSEKEDNYRGIRLLLDNVDLLKTQLRAIYKASVYGNVKVMYPMITTESEVACINEVVRNVKSELKAEGVLVGDVSNGIMIETPAAAIISERLAKVTDFFSIGTNDLTQYVFAVNREEKDLIKLYADNPEPVFELIKLSIESAHKAGIPCSICGELACDFRFSKSFIEAGIDSLSVHASKINKIRKELADI